MSLGSTEHQFSTSFKSSTERIQTSRHKTTNILTSHSIFTTNTIFLPKSTSEVAESTTRDELSITFSSNEVPILSTKSSIIPQASTLKNPTSTLQEISSTIFLIENPESDRLTQTLKYREKIPQSSIVFLSVFLPLLWISLIAIVIIFVIKSNQNGNIFKRRSNIYIKKDKSLETLHLDEKFA